MPIPPRKPKPKLSVIDDQPTPQAPPSGGARVRVENFDEHPVPLSNANAADPGVPVNGSSRAVNPRKQYPMHFDLLMRDLYERKQEPEQWQVVAAEEVRLDEMNMDVEFTIVDKRTNAVVRRCIQVQAGKLSKISDR
jgi:hypothetical protein